MIDRISGTVFLLALGINLSVCAGAQTGSGTMLALHEAISLARSNNRDLKRSGLDVAKQWEALAETKTMFYPRFDTLFLAAQLFTPLDFTVKAGQFGTFPATGAIPGTDVNIHTPARPVAVALVTATQPLTQLLRTRLYVAQRRLNVDSTQLSFEQRRQKLVDDVRRGYYAVLQSQSELESQQRMVKYLEELQQLTNRRFLQKAVLEADRLRVKAELAKATYQLTVIQDALADRKETLNHFLGRELLTDFSVETVPSTLPEEQDLSAARKVALEQRPEVKLATNRKNQAQLETRIEKTRYIPDVAVQASYFSPVNINFLPQNIGYVGALLIWQPWDWGQKRHKIAQSVLSEKQATISLDDTREQILLEVNSNFRHLREARAQLTVAEVARDAAMEKLRNQQEAYSQQSILLSDLLKEQASVAQAEDQYNQAVFGYWSTRADFQKALGEE